MSFETSCVSCLQKQEEIVRLFAQVTSPEEKYQIIIQMGKEQQHLDLSEKTEETRVQGCQSLMYLKIWLSQGKIFFQTDSDALISAGLGELVRRVYSGEPAEVVLGCRPAYLEKIGLSSHLSPSRINGLSSLLAKIRSETMKLVMASE